MLKYENDNYILYYDKWKYLEKLINTLNERVSNILEFFKPKTIRKITIKKWTEEGSICQLGFTLILYIICSCYQNEFSIKDWCVLIYWYNIIVKGGNSA